MGFLTDEANEFFIGRGASCAEGRKEEMDSVESMASVTAHLSLDGTLSGENANVNWSNLFTLRLEYLPSYIPSRIAEKILFVGKALCALKSHRTSGTGARMASGWLVTGRNGEHESAFVQTHEFCLPVKDEEEILDILENLKKADKFSLLSFETSVDKIRGLVSFHLWNLIVKHDGFIFHIQTIRDFFLLAKGEVFLAFLESTRHIFASPPTKYSEFELNTVFKKVSRTLLYANDSSSRDFVDDESDSMRLNNGIDQRKSEKRLGANGMYCLRFEEQEKQIDMIRLKVTLDSTEHSFLSHDIKKPRSYSGAESEKLGETWKKALSLEMNVEWPLDLLFTRELMTKYNHLFSFLLFVKRVKIQLESLWFSLMKMEQRRAQKQYFGRLGGSDAGIPECRESGSYSSLHFLISLQRNQMSFLVDNFLFYVQVDVLEPRFLELLSVIFSDESKHDFEMVRIANEDCIASLWTSCFLSHGPIMRCLNEIFNLCLSFCNLSFNHFDYENDNKGIHGNSADSLSVTKLKDISKVRGRQDKCA